MKQQVIEIKIEALKPVNAKQVSEQEIELIAMILSDLLIDMLQHLEDKE